MKFVYHQLNIHVSTNESTQFITGHVFYNPAYTKKFQLKTTQVMSIWEMGLDTFRKCILTNKVMQTRTVDGMLMLIEQERHGDMVDRSLLKSLLRMLADLQIYKEAFEKQFLQATEKLYAAEGQRLINERDVPEYLVHVEKRLKVCTI